MMNDSATESIAAKVSTGAAQPIAGSAIAQRISALGVTHVICIPDTNLRTAIAALHQPGMPRMIYACTEDEAVGINAGLYITGHRPMLLIQNNGFYACLNTIKAIALDAQVPTCMLIGEYGRDPARASLDNPMRAVRMLTPTLQAWSIPAFALEGPDDLDQLDAAWARAWAERGPSAAIVGAQSN